jgi:hypothetical protein
MEIGTPNPTYLTLMYVYLKTYEEALRDFECAVKNTGYPDMALMSLRQMHQERVEKVVKEMAG